SQQTLPHTCWPSSQHSPSSVQRPESQNVPLHSTASTLVQQTPSLQSSVLHLHSPGPQQTPLHIWLGSLQFDGGAVVSVGRVWSDRASASSTTVSLASAAPPSSNNP